MVVRLIIHTMTDCDTIIKAINTINGIPLKRSRGDSADEEYLYRRTIFTGIWNGMELNGAVI
jgi:hypothetical protein